MSDVAIRVEGLSKRYQIGQRERYYALRDVLTEAFSSPFRRLFSRETENRRTGEPEPIPVSPSGPEAPPGWRPTPRSPDSQNPEHVGSPTQDRSVSPTPRFPVSPNAQDPVSPKQEGPVSPIPRFPGSHATTDDGYIWALKDVSFEVKHGELVGIPSPWLRASIGRNGAETG